MERYTLSVLVENNPGVLSRVVGLFSRRGFNIHSLSVGTTQDPQVSRITIEVNGDAQIVEQVSKQLSKIMEVIKIKTLRDSEIVKRGLSLVKVKVTPKTRSEVIEITNVFRAKIVDISPNTLTIELTGHNTKLNAFIDLVEPYGIEEIKGVMYVQKKKRNNQASSYFDCYIFRSEEHTSELQSPYVISYANKTNDTVMSITSSGKNCDRISLQCYSN